VCNRAMRESSMDFSNLARGKQMKDEAADPAEFATAQ